MSNKLYELGRKIRVNIITNAAEMCEKRLAAEKLYKLQIIV